MRERQRDRERQRERERERWGGLGIERNLSFGSTANREMIN